MVVVRLKPDTTFHLQVRLKPGHYICQAGRHVCQAGRHILQADATGIVEANRTSACSRSPATTDQS